MGGGRVVSSPPPRRTPKAGNMQALGNARHYATHMARPPWGPLGVPLESHLCVRRLLGVFQRGESWGLECEQLSLVSTDVSKPRLVTDLPRMRL